MNFNPFSINGRKQDYWVTFVPTRVYLNFMMKRPDYFLSTFSIVITLPFVSNPNGFVGYYYTKSVYLHIFVFSLYTCSQRCSHSVVFRVKYGEKLCITLFFGRMSLSFHVFP